MDVILWNPSERQRYKVSKEYLQKSIGILTHIQLPNEAGHVVVLVVERQEFPGELRLILNDKAVAILEKSEKNNDIRTIHIVAVSRSPKPISSGNYLIINPSPHHIYPSNACIYCSSYEKQTLSVIPFGRRAIEFLSKRGKARE